MSRFKESRRIDDAIKHGNITELEWALSYAEMRIKNATMKDHVKHWDKISRKIKSELEEAGQ